MTDIMEITCALEKKNSNNIMLQVLKNDDNYDTLDCFSTARNPIAELRYADDTSLLSNSARGLEQLIQTVKKHNEE